MQYLKSSIPILYRKNSLTRGSVCALGGFDGVHLGHQAIIKHLKKLAGPGKRTGIITFTPLPLFVLKPVEIFYLTPKEEKEEILKELGLDFIYYFKFTKKISQLSPEEFVKLVSNNIAPSKVVVGENFHFGKDRKGTAEILKDLAAGYFGVEVLPRIKDEGTISSTRIRELLLLGNIVAANRLLGREYLLKGEVIKGKGKGTKLGFPTINLKISKEKLLPLSGVYKVRVIFDHQEFSGAMCCQDELVEVYILKFSGELYQKKVTLKILKRLRDIKKFPDDQTLKTAIAKDIKKII